MSELDEKYLFAVQDVNDPVWESDANIAAMTEVKDPADEYEGSPQYQDREPIRTSSGLLDFANNLVEEVADFLTTDDPIPPKTEVLKAVEVRERGSDRWRGRRALLTPQSASPVLVNSTFRRSLTIYNEGPNEAYLSSLPLTQLIPAAGPVPPNCFVLPPISATVFPSLRLETRDDVWGYTATGESATLNIVEEFDRP